MAVPVIQRANAQWKSEVKERAELRKGGGALVAGAVAAGTVRRRRFPHHGHVRGEHRQHGNRFADVVGIVRVAHRTISAAVAVLTMVT